MSDDLPAEDLADLYDHAPCGYVSLSPDGRIVKINQTLLDWLGLTSSEPLGKPFHALMTFGGKIAFETHLAPLLRLQGHVHDIALDLVHADGSKLPVFANAAERRGTDNAHLFTRVTVFKAVDRRTFERSLIEEKAKAEAERNAEREDARLREQFIAVLGHDLRNPLSALSAGIRLLKKEGGKSDRATLILNEMEGSARRANGLIEDVMDLARGRLGKGISADYETDADIGTIIQQVAAETRNAFSDSEIVTSIDDLAPVDCDPGRMAQLVSNLLANAVTHGASGKVVMLSATTTSDQFTLCVSNQGAKISAKARSQLFQPFIRGDAGEFRHGLGLGLFIVSEIANAHGGTMLVSSDETETKFSLQMPRKAAEQQPS